MADTNTLPPEMDNIACESQDDSLENSTETVRSTNHVHENTQPTQDAAEEYMKRFEAVEERNSRLRVLAANIENQPDQDQRLFAIMKYIADQQRLNDETYDLLVEMSNFLAEK